MIDSLFKPLRINALEIKNRIYMPAMPSVEPFDDPGALIKQQLTIRLSPVPGNKA